MTSLMRFPLRLDPGDDEQEASEPLADETPAAVPALGPELAPGPLVLLEGDRLTQRDQFAAALAHAFRLARRRARDLAERDGGMVHSLIGGKPPSVAEQQEYARSRNWVPPGHDGGTIEGMGVIAQWLVDIPGVAIGNGISAISARPFRWCTAAGLADITAIIVLALSRHDFAAVMTGLCTVLLIVAWAAAGSLLMRMMRTQPPQEPPAGHGTDEF